MLKAGDTISMTQSAVVLENLIGQFLYSKAADSGASKPRRGAAAPAPAPAFPARGERCSPARRGRSIRRRTCRRYA